MNHDLYLLGEVARRLKCPPHRIAYLLSSGQLPEPELRLGNRRMFTDGDVKRISEHLKQREAGKDCHEA